MSLNDSFRDIRHLRNTNALVKTGPIMLYFSKIKAKMLKIVKILTK